MRNIWLEEIGQALFDLWFVITCVVVGWFVLGIFVVWCVWRVQDCRDRRFWRKHGRPRRMIGKP